MAGFECLNLAIPPKQSHLLAFAPMNCDSYVDMCGEEIACPPLDAILDPVNGGFKKDLWLRHVIHFIINSDTQDDSCGFSGLRRGAVSDGFVDVKHGNSLWKPKKLTLSSASIVNYTRTLQDDLMVKLKSLGIDLTVKVTYKITGAYTYDVDINLSDSVISLTGDVRQSFFSMV